jgi:ATP-binding cassette subfamily B protein
MLARWRIIRLAPVAGPWVVLVTLAVNGVLGVLPVLFVMETSVLLGRLSEVVRTGASSAAWDSVMAVFLPTTAILLGQQLLLPVREAVGDVVARQVDGHVLHRLISASLRASGVQPFGDRALLDELGEAKDQVETQSPSVGSACAGLFALVARYLQLLGFTVAVGVLFDWWAALGLAASTMVFRYGQRAGLRKYGQFMRTLIGPRRRSQYLRWMATGAQAAKEVRVFGLTRWLTARHREAHLGWMRPLWTYRRRVYLRPYFGYTAVGLIVTGSVLAGLGISTSDGSMGVAEVALVLQATVAMSRLGEHYAEADVQTQFGMNAVMALHAYERGVGRYVTSCGGRQATVPTTAIRFDGVRFRYTPDAEPVFDGLDMEIAVGRCTAVVGLNGTGKTTLVKLLTRLYEPTAGAVRVDGVDLRDYDPAGWRRRLAVVFQDYLRFEATVADNIGFGAVEHIGDRVGIEQAARAAGLADVLDGLTDGLDTPLAAHLRGGVDLSGGQWQRVALARALFAVRHGASVLVLDEPTASLDVRAEARFYDEFVTATRGLTTVLISHRFATVRLADHIVVLEDGRVLEQGSHEQLMRAGGRYARLFSLQAEKFGAEPAR